MYCTVYIHDCEYLSTSSSSAGATFSSKVSHENIRILISFRTEENKLTTASFYTGQSICCSISWKPFISEEYSQICSKTFHLSNQKQRYSNAQKYIVINAHSALKKFKYYVQYKCEQIFQNSCLQSFHFNEFLRRIFAV